MKIFLKAVLGLAVAGVSLSAAAADGNGAFVRAELGRSFIDTGSPSETRDSTYAVRVGYYFNENFALEGSYRDLGEHLSARLDIIDNPDTNIVGPARNSSYGVGLVAKKSFGSDAHTGAFIDGRLGIAHNTIKLSGISTFPSRGSGNAPYLGIGGGYDFNHHFGASVNIVYQKDVEAGWAEIDYSTVTLGVEYRF